MSSKKRKSLPPWSVCDRCNSIIMQKDVLCHRENSCPPNSETWTHPFIMDNRLYSYLEIFQHQDENLRFVPKESRDDFALMPYHVLQLCKIPIGDPVVIKPYDANAFVPFVKFAWPMQEKNTDFTVALSTNASHINIICSKAQIIISKVEDTVPIANCVTVECESNITQAESENIMLKLEQQTVNKIYCSNNRILIKYYGRNLIFKILHITNFYNSEVLNGNCFYLIVPQTSWKINNFSEMKKKNKAINELGGLTDIISELKDLISFALSEKNILPGLNIGRGIIIHGPTGTGKTCLMESVAAYFTNNIIKIECSKIFSNVVGETEAELKCCFEKAMQTSPSIILMDELDVFCSKSNSSSDYERRIIATLSVLMDKLNSNNSLVIVLATTSKIHLIDKMLRSANRFGREVELYVPSSPQRFEILSLLLANVNHDLIDGDIKSIAESCHGFVGGDLVSLVSKAVFKNYKDSQGEQKVSTCDFEWALGKVKPSAMKEIMIEVPNVKWEDIGGQDDLKLKLRQSVEWPLKYGDSFKKLGITPPKGLLMFGPPGCSKTMIAKALATESKLNFISVKGPELFSKWVGESERAVRNVFRRARQAAPSIIFFDELDAIGGERNSSAGANVQERVLAQLLTELDGVEPLENVTVVGATNRLDRIDPALLRPGRLDRIIYVPLPDYKTRLEIFNIQLKKSSVDKDVLIDELVKKTDGYSGAEIVAVCQEAALKALEENIDADKVSRSHFMEALKIVIPRTPKSLLELYEKNLKI